MPRGGKLVGKIPSKSSHRSSTPASVSSTKGQEGSTAMVSRSVLAELHSLTIQIQVQLI